MSLCIIGSTTLEVSLGVCVDSKSGALLFKSTEPKALQTKAPPTQCDMLTKYLYLSPCMQMYYDINVVPDITYYYRLSDARGQRWTSRTIVITVPTVFLQGLTSLSVVSCVDLDGTYGLAFSLAKVNAISAEQRYYLISMSPSFSAFVSISAIDTITVSLSGGDYSSAVVQATLGAVSRTLFVYITGLPSSLEAATSVSATRTTSNGNPIGTTVTATVPAPIVPTPPGMCRSIFTS